MNRRYLFTMRWKCQTVFSLIAAILFCHILLRYIYHPHYSVPRFGFGAGNNKNKETNNVKKGRDPGDDTKYILIWSKRVKFPLNLMKNDPNIFHTYNCSFDNCYVTTNRSHFGGDLTQFEAIAFDGRSLTFKDLPSQRSFDQNYIYFNRESARYYPVCNKIFDNFFNLTATYKLDSDIVFNYFDILNKNGEVIGPDVRIDWVEGLSDVKDNSALGNKTMAVAMLVKKCKSKSNKIAFAKKLSRALEYYGYSVDIYGPCAKRKCPNLDSKNCDAIFRKNYYFYLSAENSFAADYVTKEVLVPILNNMVPIVYGAADYYRFLPPHSYLDSRTFTIQDLADLIVELIDSPKEYRRYFEWKNFYKYRIADRTRQICSICETLNWRTEKNQVCENFRKWWYPNFMKIC